MIFQQQRFPRSIGAFSGLALSALLSTHSFAQRATNAAVELEKDQAALTQKNTRGLNLSPAAREVLRLLSETYTDIATRTSTLTVTNFTLLERFADSLDPALSDIALNRIAWNATGTIIRSINSDLDHLYGPKAFFGSGPYHSETTALGIKYKAIIAKRAGQSAFRPEGVSIADVGKDLDSLLGGYVQLISESRQLQVISLGLYMRNIDIMHREIAAKVPDNLPLRKNILALKPAPFVWQQGFFDLTNTTGEAISDCVVITKSTVDKERVNARHGDSLGILPLLPFFGFSAETTDATVESAKAMSSMYATDQYRLFYIPQLAAGKNLRIKLCMPDSVQDLLTAEARVYCNEYRTDAFRIPNSDVAKLVSAHRAELQKEWEKMHQQRMLRDSNYRSQYNRIQRQQPPPPPKR